MDKGAARPYSERPEVIDMRRILVISALMALALAGCAQSSALRTSENTMIVQTSAAPVCGSTGALMTAGKVAAIETIRAGYDRFVVYDANASSNIGFVQGPGVYQTNASLVGNYGYATTTYVPGPPIAVGRHNQALAIYMLKADDPRASRAIDARSVLGPDWAKLVKSGVGTCG